ncbi:MAG TPA: DNA adenine methylase [Acidimicrobiales bacterium]|nr:DNA adenine methylase [Acidimicrobiales bacterium]
MIKYLGSKRRLVPALAAIARAAEIRTAIDLFTGTTRVAQAFKRDGAQVTAVDSARYAATFARCYIETDAAAIDRAEVARVIDHLNQLPGRPGYVTEVFCERARFFQPANGARIDAVRDVIAADWTGSELEPILLTSLIEAADRVDSTTGVQMAYVKQWAARSYHRLQLRVPDLLAGTGRALHGDAVALAPMLGPVDLAYLDPPYNQHRYTANYHVWETLTAWDAPEHYGVACKRDELRDPSTRSVFNARRQMPRALRGAIEALDARLVVVSCSNEGWASVDEVREWCASRGHAEVLAFDSRRYVGAQIGVFNPRGDRVGEPTHLHNVEYLVLSGDRQDVQRCTDAVAESMARASS